MPGVLCAGPHSINTGRRAIIRRIGKIKPEDEIRAGLPALYPRLWRFCLFLASRRDVADEIAQATCLRALQNADSFKPGSHLDRWLFVMARRIWLNERRAQVVRDGQGLVAVEDTDLPAQQPDTETNIFAREVLSEIGQLPEALRETVVLVYVEGFAYREAAEMLDIPIGTVMSRLASARKRLAPLKDAKDQTA